MCLPVGNKLNRRFFLSCEWDLTMWEINIICLICHCLKFSLSATRLETLFCEIKINFNDSWCQLSPKKKKKKYSERKLLSTVCCYDKRRMVGLTFLPSEQKIKLIDKNVARCRDGTQRNGMGILRVCWEFVFQ